MLPSEQPDTEYEPELGAALKTATSPINMSSERSQPRGPQSDRQLHIRPGLRPLSPRRLPTWARNSHCSAGSRPPARPGAAMLGCCCGSAIISPWGTENKCRLSCSTLTWVPYCDLTLRLRCSMIRSTTHKKVHVPITVIKNPR